MADNWGPISPSEWRNVRHVAGRTATEEDVAAGRAVFYIQGESAPAPISLPCCATQMLDDGSEQSVVVIQAELATQGTVLGVRPLSGGNAICLATEVHFLPAGFESRGA